MSIIERILFFSSFLPVGKLLRRLIAHQVAENEVAVAMT